MGISSPNSFLPHYFILRKFLGENDLLVILNTKRCRYHCYFCQLPAKSSKTLISGEDIIAQFRYVITEVKHALSILDRVTISNDGSVLDSETLPIEALMQFIESIQEIRRVRTLVLETRLEFVNLNIIREIKSRNPRSTINILTGFETVSQEVRDVILHKKETLATFLAGLDIVAETKSELTAYVLYKPSPYMTDEEAFSEANKTIDYLVEQCKIREIPLTLRLNPMYLAEGSRWGRMAHSNPGYLPPLLTHVFKLAQQKRRLGVNIYIGLSTEGISTLNGAYQSREDYSSDLLKAILKFNGDADSFTEMTQL